MNLSRHNLSKLFPFYLKMDTMFLISDCGPSMQKMLGDLTGLSFGDQFQVVRPSLWFSKSELPFKDLLNELIIIESTHYPVKTTFRGQIIHLEETDEYLLLGTPWFKDLSELSIYNLTFSDFAINDTLPDLFNILQSKEIAQTDMTQFAEELIEERNKLLEKNREIEMLAQFPEQNPQPIIRINSEGELLYVNTAAKSLIKKYPFQNVEHRKAFYEEHSSSNLNVKVADLFFEKTVYKVTCVSFTKEKYINVYFSEITDLIQYQENIETVNAQFTTLINSMQSALLVEDLHRKIIMVNDRFCDFFGVPVPKEQLKGLDCGIAGEQSKLLFDDEEAFLKGVQVAISGKENIFGERLKLKDGRIFERDYIPLIKDGEIQGHIWKYDDITEVIRSKESLQRVEDKYKKIIEELHFGLIEVDLEQRITKVFPAFCRMTGYSEDELLGQLASEILGLPEEIDQIELQNEDRKKGESGVYETRIKTKQGEIKTVIISGSPIFSPTGEILGSIGIHIDISDRKKLENELREAQERAYAHVKAKDLFVAKMSHEIRTPMNVIIGLSDVLNDMNLGEEQRHILSSIRLSASNLLGIVNDILDFSSLENDHYKILESEFAPSLLLNELHTIFKNEANKKGLNFTIHVDQSVEESLIGDRQKLNQVLINLLGNALKFTFEGSVGVSLSLLEDTPESQRLRFAVKDTGLGISKEMQEAIFSDFIQEEVTTGVNFGGSGLGLAISSMIISKMGGAIRLESEKGEGSMFYFDLELKKSKNIHVNRQIETDVELDPNWKILIAEDNPQNQLLITTLLKKHGLPIQIVNNGQEAIEMLGVFKYDLVLMDIQMPVLNGLDALIEIRNNGNTIPVIALTANASDKDREKYMEVGFNSVVIKPFRKNELFSEICRLLGKEHFIPSQSKSSTSEKVEIEKVSFSLDELHVLVGDDKGFMRELISTFLDNTPRLVNQITNGTLSGDDEPVKFALHQIKPSLRLFMANDLLQMVVEMEQLTDQNGDKEGLKQLAMELDRKTNRLIQELRIFEATMQ